MPPAGRGTCLSQNPLLLLLHFVFYANIKKVCLAVVSVTVSSGLWDATQSTSVSLGLLMRVGLVGQCLYVGVGGKMFPK